MWPNDSESVELLQEYIGYILSGRTDMQKMLLLIGPTRSGKGTIARMLAQLIGRGHVGRSDPGESGHQLRVVAAAG